MIDDLMWLSHLLLCLSSYSCVVSESQSPLLLPCARLWAYHAQLSQWAIAQAVRGHHAGLETRASNMLWDAAQILPRFTCDRAVDDG